MPNIVSRSVSSSCACNKNVPISMAEGMLCSPQGWVKLHKITSITITLKYQLQLQLYLHNVILNYNYNYDMFITITVQLLRELHLYLWKCVLINYMGCFPCLACCLVTLALSLAMLFGSIKLQHLISYHVWDNCTRSYQVKRQNIWMSFYYTEHIILELQFIWCDKKTTNNESHTFMVMLVMSSDSISYVLVGSDQVTNISSECLVNFGVVK